MSKRKDRFVITEPTECYAVEGNNPNVIWPLTLKQAQEKMRGMDVPVRVRIYELVPYKPKKRGKK